MTAATSIYDTKKQEVTNSMPLKEEDLGPNVLRVASINTLNSREALPYRYGRIAELLEGLKVDVVLLQEVIEPDALREDLETVGFSFWAQTLPDSMEGAPKNEPGAGDCRAIASRVPLDAWSMVELGVGQRAGLFASLEVGKQTVNFLTAHFAWGGNAEQTRLKQAMKINDWATRLELLDPEAITILGGDLNANEDSRTVRYLRGLDLDLIGNSTYWTDAYLTCGDESEWATTDQSRGTWGPSTAARRGVLRTDLLPARRIDYFLTYGWKYGKLGSPIAYGRFGMAETLNDLDMSDHYGIFADFMV